MQNFVQNVHAKLCCAGSIFEACISIKFISFLLPTSKKIGTMIKLEFEHTLSLEVRQHISFQSSVSENQLVQTVLERCHTLKSNSHITPPSVWGGGEEKVKKCTSL